MSEKEKIVSVLLSGEHLHFLNLIPVTERFSFSSFRERTRDLPKFGGNCEA